MFLGVLRHKITIVIVSGTMAREIKECCICGLSKQFLDLSPELSAGDLFRRRCKQLTAKVVSRVLVALKEPGHSFCIVDAPT